MTDSVTTAQQRVQIDQGACDEHQHHDVADGGDANVHEFLELEDIVLDARHDAANLVPVVERSCLVLQVIEHLGPEVVQDIDGDAGERDVLHEVESHIQQHVDDKEDSGKLEATPSGLLPGDAVDELVDGPADDEGLEHHGDDVSGHADEGRHHPGAVGQRVLHQAHNHAMVVQVAHEDVVKGGTPQMPVTANPGCQSETSKSPATLISCSVASSRGFSCDSYRLRYSPPLVSSSSWVPR